MTMEKYSIDSNTMLLNLQNEEGQIMSKIGACLSNPFDDESGAEQQRLEARLKDVRYKIDELRSKKSAEGSVQDS